MKVLMLPAALLSAAAATPPPANPPEERVDDQSRVVCVQSTEIGSRLRQRRVCRTRAQWDELRRNTRTIITRMQSTREAPGE